MRLNFKKAKKLCGLDDKFEIRSTEQFEFAMTAWKALTVQARTEGNDALAADLSQCKEIFKRRHHNRVVRRCPVCGDFKNPYADHCNTCSRNKRYYRNVMNETSVLPKEHVIENGVVLIGPRCHTTGILTQTLRKMADDSPVGDSFITDKQPASVKNIARLIGLQIMIRIANPQEKDLKKRRWRVWRTDGLPMEDVNKIIKDRMGGKPAPAVKICVPDPEEAEHKSHKKKETTPKRREPSAVD
jgi:hypothetical protein